MKRQVIIVLVVLLLCACSRQEYEQRPFSFEEDCIDYYEDMERALRPNPGNQKRVRFMNHEKAVKIAKKYCTFGNAEASVAYDWEADMYRVTFIQAFPMDGYVVYSTGGVTVYLNGDGIVQMVIHGE